MSGTVSGRAITLTLSVANAAKIQDDLRSLGAIGEESLRRLETAAQRASGSNSVAKLGNDGANSFRGMSQTIGAAGYQLQDFAVQVQGGTSALTALAQQGSQFLGVFGTGGAIAGAVLTVGALALSMLGFGKETKEAAEQQKRFNEALERTPKEAFTLAIDGANKALRDYNEAVETATQKTIRLARESRQTALDGLNQQAGNLTVEILDLERRRTEALRPVARVGSRMQQQAGNEDGSLQPEDQAQLLKSYGRVQTDVEQYSRRIAAMQASRDEITRRAIPLQQLLAAPMGVGGIEAGSLNAPPDKPESEKTGRSRVAREPVDPEVMESYRTLTKSLEEIDGAADKSYVAFVRLKNSLDPAAAATDRFKDAQATLSDALDRGVIGQDDYAKYVNLARDAMDKSIAKAGEVAVSGREIATVFTSAFDGMITGSGKASDAIKRLELGIARMIERAAITGPLEKALGGLDFGSLVKSGYNYVTGSSASGLNYSPVNNNYSSTNYLMANGGIMTSLGALPLHKYAGGGVARSPQVAIFGEARRPEAYVPLPDGRSIPVTMAGGSGGGAVIQIDARGADAGVEQRINAVLARRMPSIIAASRADTAAQVNRGGGLAKTFGRRS